MLKKRIASLLFNPKFILSTHILIGIVVSAFLVFNYFFGFGVLENAHLTYMRYRMKDVALVHNFEGAGGTGWLTKVKKEYYIITNAHVCGLAVNGLILVNYKGYDSIQEVKQVYPKHDLCAITAPDTASGGFSIAKSVSRGESVYTLGHPYLEPNTITKGELSGAVTIKLLVGENVPKERCSGPGFELIDAGTINPFLALAGIETVCIRSLNAEASPVTILPGNSGSPTVNIYGNVVAVAFAGNEAGTRSYHVPLEVLKEFLNGL